jgi:hypothetical protein
MTVTAAPLTVLTVVVCLVMALFHLMNFTVPNQQRQLVRVLVVPAVFSIFSIIGLCFYRDSPYVIAIADFYETFALIGFFYYIVSIVTPDESTRLEFFQQLDSKEERGNMKSGGDLNWFYV